MKLKKAFFALLIFTCGTIFLSTSIANSVFAADEVNDVTLVNTNGPETAAHTIDYSGVETGVYGIQAYVGLKGPYWITDEDADFVEHGTGSHKLGSNSSDGRSNLELTFLINSTVSGDADLIIYVFKDETNTTGSMKVNDEEPVNVNFYELNHYTHDASVPSAVKVTLKEGQNEIVLTMQENYTAWFAAFKVEPHNPDRSIPTYDAIKVTDWIEKTGDMSANNFAFGLNAFDNPIDYGKTGSITYQFSAVDAGEYELSLAVMAGNSLGNRVKISLNNEVYLENGKPYISFDTSAGWNYSLQKYNVTLNSGINTIKFENVLTLVNADKTSEVEDGTDGAVLVSNWWINGISFKKADVKPTQNDVALSNTNGSNTEAFPVAYNGEATGRYGIQAYAGVKGPYWIVGTEASNLVKGQGSHILGSNAGDGRNNLEVTFLIDSTIAGLADLIVYLYKDEFNSHISLKVNDEDEQFINLYDLNHIVTTNEVPVTLPVTLKEGLNTIVITMQEDYTAWFASFEVLPHNPERDIVTLDNIKITSWSEKSGNINVDNYAFGLNAFDNAADYGKTGLITYKFMVDTAGQYYLFLNVRAGNNLANRAKITINGDVYTVDEKEYVAFSAAAGWGGLTENRYPIDLKAGENVITIENVLTLVNAEKTEEVSEGTPGAVLVSNWWCENIRFEAVPQIELVIDTTNAKTIYNLNRDFIDSNLRVIYKVDGEETELTPEQYTIDSSGFNNQALGSYRIYVMMNDSELESYYNVSVIEEGLPFEGQVLEFNGEGTGADTYSYYNYAKIIGEGEGIYNDRLFWTVANQKLKDGGYTFGSNGVGNDENRQMTLTLMINSTVSGKFIIKSYAECYQEPQGNLIIKVNENDPYTINTFFTNLDTPFMFEVDLVVGLNTVEMKFSDAYAAWLRYFEITPIDYSDIDESFIPKNGVRSSLGFLDSNNDYVWKTKAGNSSLNYYLKVEEAFSYKFIINTVNNTATNGKLFIDGVAYDFTVGTNNQAIAIVDLAAGDHNLVLNFLASADEHFGFVDMTVAKNAVPEEITLDTSDINLTVNYDGIFDTTALKVTVKFNDGTSRELLRSEYKVIMPTGYDTKVPGEYTIRIELLSDSEMYETFKVTVQEKPVDPDENPDDENPIETPVDEEPSSPKVRIEFVIGAALVAVALLVSAFVLIRRRRKL